jgi:hypothetical protein
MALVYKITNRNNNKSYIGHTARTLEQRWKSHLSAARQGSKFRFHSAIRKYGIDVWNKEILFENNDINIVKLKEEDMIQFYKTQETKIGYNAKTGGCGGFIVPPHKYDSWREQLSVNNTGLGNPNSIKYSNEELLEIGKTICIELGRIVGLRTMVKECKKRNIEFPKAFTKFRFGGNYRNFVSIIEQELNMIYNPYYRSEESKKHIRDLYTGKIGHNKNTKVIITPEGFRKHVKN